MLEQLPEQTPSSEDPAQVNLLRRGLRRLGIDRAIAFTVVARGWSSLAGIVTMALIARFLSPVEQGFYYTFVSLVAIQIVFELGFSYVILQMASHERAHLSISADYVVTGDPIALSRLASVIQKSVRWYSIAAVALFMAILPAGLIFFSTSKSAAGSQVAWRLPWMVAALAVTFTFQIDPVLSFLEGCGYVSDIARLRFFQSMAGSFLAWCALILGYGLFSPAMMMLGMAFTASAWLFRRKRLLRQLLRHDPGEHRIHWMKEVWAFQWRIAVSWLCGYFLFQLFSPIAFRYWGPVTAGRLGMSLSIANAMQSMAISWISTKSAPFGMLIARKQYKQLDQLFFRALAQGFGINLLTSVILWLACVYCNVYHLSYANRILPPLPFLLLLGTNLINIPIFGGALYLRAHKQEKFLPLSVAGAVLITISTLVLGRRFGPTGMMAGYLAVTFFLQFGAFHLFTKYRNLWHREQPEAV